VLWEMNEAVHRNHLRGDLRIEWNFPRNEGSRTKIKDQYAGIKMEIVLSGRHPLISRVGGQVSTTTRGSDVVRSSYNILKLGTLDMNHSLCSVLLFLANGFCQRRN
jgi:hypothetical protein